MNEELILHWANVLFTILSILTIVFGLAFATIIWFIVQEIKKIIKDREDREKSLRNVESAFLEINELKNQMEDMKNTIRDTELAKRNIPSDDQLAELVKKHLHLTPSVSIINILKDKLIYQRGVNSADKIKEIFNNVDSAEVSKRLGNLYGGIMPVNTEIDWLIQVGTGENNLDALANKEKRLIDARRKSSPSGIIEAVYGSTEKTRSKLADLVNSTKDFIDNRSK